MSMNIDPMKIDQYYFPVNLSLFQNLEGKMLTHVEAMNLPASAEKANKDLVRQTLWKWFEGVQENSLTSWQGCIGPILGPPHGPAKDGDRYVWLTNVGEIEKIKDNGQRTTKITTLQVK